MGKVWSPENKMECWLEVELAATEAWAEEGTVPREAVEACRANAAFTVEAVDGRERVTDHDVAAFVDVVADSVGEHGRWIHYGLTSSDVLDTALALQLRQAGELLLAGAKAYRDALKLPEALSPHSLRHSHVTHLTEDGVDRRFIQCQVGHEADSSTAIYTHVSDDFMNTALRRALAPALGSGHQSHGKDR